MRHRPRTRGLLAVVAIPAALTPILGASALASEPTVTVQPGDTLSGIAVEHGVRVEELTALNALPDPNRIFVGQQLRLVAAEPAGAAGAAPPGVDAPATHVVARGENLAIPRLATPGGSASGAAATPPLAAPAASATVVTHTVAAGENLTRIARQYGATIAAIVAANGIANPSRIHPGQQLAIPGGPTAPAFPAGREEVRAIIV